MNFGNLFTQSLFQSIPLFRKIISAVTGSSAWLINAMPLKVYRSKDKRVRQLVNEIYSEIIQHIQVQKTPKIKEAIDIVLLNLWMGAFFNRPTRYSRNRNDYKSGKRYALLFKSYDYSLQVIDTLKDLGYINHKMGFWEHDKKFGRQSRMWTTEALMQRFEDAGLCNHGFFTSDRPKDPIIKRDKNKREIQYVDDRKTNKWRAQVKQYNSYIDNSRITVVLNGLVPVTIRFLIQFLYQYVIKGVVRINTINLTQLNHIPYHNQYYPNTDTVHYHHILYTMTKRKHWKHKSIVPINELTEPIMLHHYFGDVNVFIRAFDDFDSAEAFLNQAVLLKAIGIEHLEFQLVYEYLHRVFNDSSFSRGGRFYGAIHLSLPRDLRAFIHIDGQPTVELDYSAFHIKMLYHKEGIDYQDDPYSACEGAALRKVYKAVGLIAINAENAKKAYGAIADELKDRGLIAPKRDEPIVSLVNAFKQTHLPIQKHLFSGVGTKLQNIDSDIMNSILARLLGMDIVGLPVHDSVIVPAQYKDILEALMIEEYQKQMGFKPVVDIK
jgi:hypothetical protein